MFISWDRSFLLDYFITAYAKKKNKILLNSILYQFSSSALVISLYKQHTFLCNSLSTYLFSSAINLYQLKFRINCTLTIWSLASEGTSLLLFDLMDITTYPSFYSLLSSKKDISETKKMGLFMAGMSFSHRSAWSEQIWGWILTTSFIQLCCSLDLKLSKRTSTTQALPLK